MYMELHEFSTIIAGYTFRGAIEPDPEGHVFVFQAKDLVQDEPIRDTNSLTRISHEVPGYTGHLKTGDVLVVARGMKAGSFRSTIFASDAENVIASSSIHVIRITDERIFPEYLSLYLNSKEGQAAISQIVTGSYVGAVPRMSLERLKIPLLPPERQRTFIELNRNIREQIRITSRQNKIKEEIISETFRKLITN